MCLLLEQIIMMTHGSLMRITDINIREERMSSSGFLSRLPLRPVVSCEAVRTPRRGRLPEALN